MQTGMMDKTIEELLRMNPPWTKAFDTLGIDYCCGGKRTLAQACQERGLDPAEVESTLAGGADIGSSAPGEAGMGLGELADHILRTYHASLRKELCRLAGYTEKVARVHGRQDPRLMEIRDLFGILAEDLLLHLKKEDEILFPSFRQLGKNAPGDPFRKELLANPVKGMKQNHADVARSLAEIRKLSDGYVAPEWACGTYGAMMDGLRTLDADITRLIRTEEDLLFPLALGLA